MPSLLSQKAMLASLHIRQWSAVKMDRKVSREVHESHNAAADAGRYNKRLVSKSALESIAAIAGEARELHYKRTLPWQDNGTRLLPTAGFVPYSEAMRDLRGKFETAVAAFVAEYPAIKESARTRLNGMFNEADYPAPAEIAGRFAFDRVIMNCPDAGDFRVDLAAEQVAELQADIEARTNEALGDAMRDVWSRINEAVGRMAERLRAYKPGDETKRAEGVFRDSLVENVRELVDLLPALNLTGDAALATVAERMKAELCTESAKELRDNASARESVAAAAESILATVGGYLA